MAVHSIAHSIRSSVVRLVLVACLAVTLVGGSIALSSPSEASAAKYTCAQALSLSRMWLSIGDVYYSVGSYAAAAAAYGKSAAYADFC
jgi:hypothetical protein